MLKIGIVGASGYTGAELFRWLGNHPEASVVWATSETFAGQKLNALYPALGPAGEIPLVSFEQVDRSAQAVDVIFLAVPHGESMALAPKLVESGIRVIDLSGDFRFHEVAVYEAWYKRTHTAPEWVGKAVYGLPELFRESIRSARLVANPGCFVTAAVLALYPLVKQQWVDSRTLIVDAKTGISGAGRKVTPETSFNRVSENVVPYKMAGVHQHTPEMEHALERAVGRPVRITFSPQLVPARRGILAVAYGHLQKKISSVELTALYQEMYSQEPFVQVRREGEPWPDLAGTVGTNGSRVAAAVDERTGLAVVAASLDNLVKGASGQAVQNMNLMFGLDETLGLSQMGMVP